MLENEKKHTVLLVEPNKREADKLKYIFEELYNFVVHFDIESAINYIENNSVDIILTETLFSNSNNSFLSNMEQKPNHGFDLCQYIKNHEQKHIKNIIIIFLSGLESSKDIARAFEYGASDFIKKPYDILELFSRVELRIEKKAEKESLHNSINELVSDRKTRNKKNIDMKTAFFAKYKTELVKHQQELDQLKIQNEELKNQLNLYQKHKIENEKLLRENRVLRAKIKQSQNQSHEDYSKNEELTKEIFNKINTEFKFDEVYVRKISDDIIKNNISFESIDNLTFINTIIETIKVFIKNRLLRLDTSSVLKEQIISNLDNLLEYITKTSLNKFLFYFSVELLEKISEKNENAIKFLQFYDGKTEITASGIRFQKPVIQSENGTVWNLVSIMQVMNHRIKGKESIKEQKQLINNITIKLSNIRKQIQGLLSREQQLYCDKLKEQQPFSEKISVMVNILQNEKNKLSKKDTDGIAEVELKIIKLHNIEKLATKYIDAIEKEEKKYASLVDYYKPTEEKFSRIALSIAKNFLRIKVIR